MGKIIYELKTITPLLMNRLATDPSRSNLPRQMRNAPEVRAASFRGVFRYWLRAVLGSVIGPTVSSAPYKTLNEYESAIFGSTSSGSKVKVMVESNLKPQKGLYVLPTQVYNQRRNTNEPYEQYGFYDDEDSIYLTLQSHPLTDLPDLLIETVMVALHLGGFGRRARRLGGNFQIMAIDDAIETLPKDGEALSSLLRDYVNAAIGMASHHTKLALLPASVGRPAFPAFQDGYYHILIHQGSFPTPEDAGDKMWQITGPYHHDQGPYGNANPRRPSAIHMKVCCSQASYHPVMTIFESGSNQEWARARVDQLIHDAISGGFVEI